MFAYDIFEIMKKKCNYCKVEYYQKSNEIWCSPKCRLLSKIKRKKNGCWEFQGSIRRGYGQFKIENKNFATHRASYEIFKGKIPKGKFVCHTCDNKICVNPDHLFLGTPLDNMLDKTKKGRGYRPTGEKHHKAKLTERDVLKIRKMYKFFKTPHRRIAEYFKVSRNNVTNIINKKFWKHVGDEMSVHSFKNKKGKQYWLLKWKNKKILAHKDKNDVLVFCNSRRYLCDHEISKNWYLAIFQHDIKHIEGK